MTTGELITDDPPPPFPEPDAAEPATSSRPPPVEELNLNQDTPESLARRDVRRLQNLLQLERFELDRGALANRIRERNVSL